MLNGNFYKATVEALKRPDKNWVPVASYNPIRDGRYQITIIRADGSRWVCDAWFIDGKWKNYTPIAWMELPLPYDETDTGVYD